MALINDRRPLRTASVVAETHVSLAMLSKKDFKQICRMYPNFRMRITFMAKIRKE